MSDTINYGQMMHRAMRGLLVELLTEVAVTGLPGEHHFFITFDTTHPDVEIADWLRERYPEEMTIVVQHWFENLDVTDEKFAVTLNFGNQPERLVVPFEAIHTFVDPSVEFGLRFEGTEEEEFEDSPESPMVVLDDDEDDAREARPKGDAEVVSLDSFRKH
jgi:hypothetical protein